MFFLGTRGPSLVSDEFNQMCTDAHVEARVRPLANPGDPYNALRVISFRNFGSKTATVTQFNKRNDVHTIPAKGGIEIMLGPDEPLPYVEEDSCPTTS